MSAGGPNRDLAAYARGVNYFSRRIADSLPLEFTVLRYDPRPWRMRDSILCGLQMYRTLTTSWREEITRRHMLSSGDPAKVNLSVSRAHRRRGPARLERLGDFGRADGHRQADSGQRSAPGMVVLPSTWYQVHLKAPGLDVTGVSLPGLPGVIIGHNTRIAWGVTNLGFDVQDLYREQIDPQTGRYLFQGQWSRRVLERGGIAREECAKAGGVPAMGDAPRSDGLLERADGISRCAGRRPSRTDSQFPFLDIDRAQQLDRNLPPRWRASRAPARISFTRTSTENIGYHATGRLPIRRNYDGDVPVDGSSGECEWEGFIPFDQLPASYNPSRGWIVTANQNPFPANYPYPVNGDFGPPYRAAEIRDRLTARGGGSRGHAGRAEGRVFFVREPFGAADRKCVRSREAGQTGAARGRDLLRSWNGQMEKQTAAPLLVMLTYQQLEERMVKAPGPGRPMLTNRRWRHGGPEHYRFA